nr:hypothetical protein GCM10020185_49170 [Pseudomonas brassicacearum subsp. brassicacearum]
MVAPAVMRLDEQSPLPMSGELTVIQPETDEVVDPQLVYEWSDTLQRPHELLKVAECGHFFSWQADRSQGSDPAAPLELTAV